MLNFQIDFRTLKVRFFDKFLVLNPKKCHLMTLEIGTTFTCNDIIIKNSLSDKILGLTIDNNLNLSDCIFSICNITNQKLTAVLRVSPNINSDKFSLLINSFKPGCSVTEKA